MKYIYNFPISMLRGFMENTDSVLDDILNFCILKKYNDCDDIDTVEKTLGITIGNARTAISRGKDLERMHDNNGSPWTGISHDLFWCYFRKNRNDFDKATLLAFLAIKSIVGQKPYYKLSKQSIIFKRMSSYKDCDKVKIPKGIANFTSRYRFDKIKMELIENWNVVFYASHVRGMYISLSMSLYELALQAERNKIKMRQKRQTFSVEEARKNALDALKKQS